MKSKQHPAKVSIPVGNGYVVVEVDIALIPIEVIRSQLETKFYKMKSELERMEYKVEECGMLLKGLR